MRCREFRAADNACRCLPSAIPVTSTKAGLRTAERRLPTFPGEPSGLSRQTLQRCVRQAALGYRCGGSAGFDQLPVSGCSIRAGSTPWRIKNVAHLKVRGGSGTSESAASRRVVRSCHVGRARCSVTGRPGAHARRLRCRRRRGHIRRASGSVWRARRSSPASPSGALA